MNFKCQSSFDRYVSQSKINLERIIKRPGVFLPCPHVSSQEPVEEKLVWQRGHLFFCLHAQVYQSACVHAARIPGTTLTLVCLIVPGHSARRCDGAAHHTAAHRDTRGAFSGSRANVREQRNSNVWVIVSVQCNMGKSRPMRCKCNSTTSCGPQLSDARFGPLTPFSFSVFTSVPNSSFPSFLSLQLLAFSFNKPAYTRSRWTVSLITLKGGVGAICVCGGRLCCNKSILKEILVSNKQRQKSHIESKVKMEHFVCIYPATVCDWCIRLMNICPLHHATLMIKIYSVALVDEIWSKYLLVDAVRYLGVSKSNLF